MKFPRDVSGSRVISHLCKHWGYRRVDQKGSHVLLISDTPQHHRLPVPLHTPLGIGIFKKILAEVREAKNITEEELLRDL